jgi:hypothetical protein
MEVAHKALEALADAVSGPTWGNRTPLFEQAKERISTAAGLIIALKERCHPETSTLPGPEMLRGTMSAGMLGYQLVAANMLLDGMALATIAEGEDQAFLQDAMVTAEEAYQSHVSMLASVLRTRDRGLYGLNTAIIGLGTEPRAEFDVMKEEFALVKERQFALQRDRQKTEESES